MLCNVPTVRDVARRHASIIMIHQEPHIRIPVDQRTPRISSHSPVVTSKTNIGTYRAGLTTEVASGKAIVTRLPPASTEDEKTPHAANHRGTYRDRKSR